VKARLFPLFVLIAASGCATRSPEGTLAELRDATPDTAEVELENSLELAADSYRRYLAETPVGEMTPEAMRRLADLEIEKEFGIIGGGRLREMAAPETAALPAERAVRPVREASEPSESDLEFERRATASTAIEAADAGELELPGDSGGVELSGPRDAVEMYRRILENYPNYERNDQVLYQMSRAFDELGEPDRAIDVMERLIAEYPWSRHIDEVQFRRGEYYFVRRKYLDAEVAYLAIIDMGAATSYYELALYKMGWTLYKQELYEEALHRYIAMLDHRLANGYDFDGAAEEDGEHRIADTFRVISLSFSNLGGPEVIDEYFSARGHRGYADRIYSNLGEFYLEKLRYQDAAAVYGSFIELNPFHRQSPHFGMRIVEIYEQGGFPKLVVESKKDFADRYALDAAYWTHFSQEELPEVIELLKANLTDLANHYHALYQDEEFADEKPQSFAEASKWYDEYLGSFPDDPASPSVNYQLADLLLENGDYGAAALQYERTAYDYPAHEQSSAAGYAAIYAHRENLKQATGASRLEQKRATVTSSLRFADSFADHEQAPVVLGAAADDLYDMQDFPLAIESARKLIERYPSAEPGLLRSAWVVVAHSSMDISEYVDAEQAYGQVLDLTAADDDTRPAVVDGLAAAIYKQGEEASLTEDYRSAADHFLRIGRVASTSTVRAAAEFDGAAALMKLEAWAEAADVFEDFRKGFPDHELNADATRQLAHAYREDGQLERSAVEHERIADETEEPELRGDALLVAGDLYEQVDEGDAALRVYSAYADEFPRPLDVALETRTKIAELHKAKSDYSAYHAELEHIVAIDRDSGPDRSDRSRYLAGRAALVLAELLYERFAELDLTLPFEESLAEKQRRMDATMAALEALVQYEVAEVTAAATYYMAETFYGFSQSLLESERPGNLSAAERMDYDLVIEEEAYPFEERAIEVHEENFELLTVGVFNDWVQKSLDRLVVLVPGTYAKNEISSGFLGSIDGYAYRMPNAGGIGLDEEAPPELTDAAPVPGSVRTARLGETGEGPEK